MARPLEFEPEEKIICALDVFWSKGYTAASLADLTEAMGINKSSFYNSFGDKHTLFTECLKAYGKITEKDYAAALQADGTPLEKICRVIDQIVGLTINRSNSCMGVKTSFELAAQDEEVRALIKAGNQKTIALIKDLIRQAQETGEIKTSRNAEVMASFVFSAFAGFRQSYILFKNKDIVCQMADEMKAYLAY